MHVSDVHVTKFAQFPTKLSGILPPLECESIMHSLRTKTNKKLSFPMEEASRTSKLPKVTNFVKAVNGELW